MCRSLLLQKNDDYEQHKLAENVNLRNTPEITFVMDQSIEYGVRMSHLIDEVNKENSND